MCQSVNVCLKFIYFINVISNNKVNFITHTKYVQGIIMILYNRAIVNWYNNYNIAILKQNIQSIFSST